MAWIENRNRLSQSEMENNATEVYNILSSYNWSVQAIASILGNMQYESSINPGVIEGYASEPYAVAGYGLIQWTEINATKPQDNPLWLWTYQKYGDYDWDNGFRQCTFIATDDRLFWIPTTNYNMSYDDFKKSTMSVSYLAKAYFYNRERGTWSDLRATYARNWYNYLKQSSYIPPVPVQPLPYYSKTKMPLYYYDELF